MAHLNTYTDPIFTRWIYYYNYAGLQWDDSFTIKKGYSMKEKYFWKRAFIIITWLKYEQYKIKLIEISANLIFYARDFLVQINPMSGYEKHFM